MSDLMNVRDGRHDLRWQLLASASAMTLLAVVYGATEANAADSDVGHPTVWIELGAQSEQISGFGGAFAPPFTSQIIADGFTSPLGPQHALNQSFGGEGKISLEPKGSDWVISATIRYGRANGSKKIHEQNSTEYRYSHSTTGGGFKTGSVAAIHHTAKFAETRTSNNETHAILDFQAGKDFGLGLFNGAGQSTVSIGVRFAQFTSKQVLNLNADPDFHFPVNNIATQAKYHHTYIVQSHMERNFRGLGPSLSWNASVPVIGDTDEGGITLDWGMNAALLYGRQEVTGHHQTTGDYYKLLGLHKYPALHTQRSGDPNRSRGILVPNIGGSVGASFRFSNAKVSVGYRADFFFGAMDNGVDTRKSEDIGFHGPFATISLGLGG